MARPSTFSQELADSICARLAEGESLREICRDDDLPNVRTVLRWVGQNRSFEAQYREAREAMEMHFLEEMRTIASDGSRDWVDRPNRDGTTTRVFDHEHVQRSKLRVETLRNMLAMMSPKKYGFKTGSGNETPAADAWAPQRAISDLERAKAVTALLSTVGDGLSGGGLKLVPRNCVAFIPPPGVPAEKLTDALKQMSELILIAGADNAMLPKAQAA